MARWTVKEITAIRTVTDGGPDDPVWYPLQHALGLETFGVNLSVANRPCQTLVEEHDELYVLVTEQEPPDGRRLAYSLGGTIFTVGLDGRGASRRRADVSANPLMP